LQITIWTIEHSIRTINEFLELLEEYGIQTVVDVRRFPTSKIEHFKKEQMEKWVPKHKLDYFWLGKELRLPPRGIQETHANQTLQSWDSSTFRNRKSQKNLHYVQGSKPKILPSQIHFCTS